MIGMKVILYSSSQMNPLSGNNIKKNEEGRFSISNAQFSIQVTLKIEHY